MINQDNDRWKSLMKVAFGYLKIDPEKFWKMTPQEFAMILETYQESLLDKKEAISQRNLQELKEIFPDKNPPSISCAI